MIITDLPDEIDVSVDCLVDCWAERLGVSAERVRQCVKQVGNSAKRVAKAVKDGCRIAIADDDGVMRLVAQIGFLKDGFFCAVPYHPARNGLLMKSRVDYTKSENVVSFDEMEKYFVSDGVKLSMHLGGLVHFSTLGKPIVSGFNEELQKPKGIGLHNSHAVSVVTGPLFGLIVQGLGEFKQLSSKVAERFEAGDLWHHPMFSTPQDVAFSLEFFLLPRTELRKAYIDANGKQLLTRALPFKGSFKFDFTLRVIEVPNLDCFLGLIVSRITCDDSISSGYKLSGPGCFDKQRNAFSIAAWYPVPPMIAQAELPSLDYRPNS